MPTSAYILVWLSPLLAGVGVVLGGWWTWLHPVVMYGLITVLDLGLKGTTDNHPQESDRDRAEHWLANFILWSLAPILLVLLFGFLAKVDQFNSWELVGLGIGVGTSLGTLGINGGHELGHDRGVAAKRLAEILLLVTFYMHFHVEHNRGHHARVCTPDDPATARKGQSLYGFWFQTLSGSIRSAWNLEQERLAKVGQGPWRLQNAMVRYGLLKVVLLVGTAVVLGPAAVVAWVLTALFGILMLETTNYFQHYGLVRQQQEDGSWERVGPQHSWTSNHPISRMVLLNLPRHADHHMAPGRHFTNLRHLPESPVLPMGYSGMIMLSFVPPAFTWLMDKRIAQA